MAGPITSSINWDNVRSFTSEVWLPETTDQIYNSNPTAKKFMGSGIGLDGGTKIHQRVMYGQGPVEWYDGAQPQNMSDSQKWTTLIFDWKHSRAAEQITWTDELQNNGKAASGKLIAEKLDSMRMTMDDAMGGAVFNNGADPLQPVGLQAMVAGTGTTYGGLSGTTNVWHRSVSVDMTSTPITINKLRQTRGLVTQGAITPDFIVTTQTIYDLVYALGLPQQSFVNTTSADMGFKSYAFEGIPLLVDSHCPSGMLFMLTTKYAKMFYHTMDNMKLWNWAEAQDQFVKTIRLSWSGNMVCSNRRFQAKLSNITS